MSNPWTNPTSGLHGPVVKTGPDDDPAYRVEKQVCDRVVCFSLGTHALTVVFTFHCWP